MRWDIVIKRTIGFETGQQYKELKTIVFAEERVRLAIGFAQSGVYEVDILSKFNYPLLPA